MAKVTLSKIKDQLSEIQRQLSALLSDTENDTNISPELRAFDDQLFTPLRTDVLKFLLQEDVPFSAKKELFDAIQTTGKEILNAAPGQGVINNSPLDVVIGELRELDDLVTRTVIRDQKISLVDINKIHKQYFDEQSFINNMANLYPDDNMFGALDMIDLSFIYRFWLEKQKIQPDQRQDHAASSVTDNQGQPESGTNQDVDSQQTVERQAMAEIIFRQLCFIESRMTEINTAISSNIGFLLEGLGGYISESIGKIKEKCMECYLLQLDLCNQLNEISMTIENESVDLSTDKQSVNIMDVMKLINKLKRSGNPIDVGSAISQMQSQEVSIDKKEAYLSEYDEYVVFLSKEDRGKLSPNFVKQALQKRKTNGLLLSDTILKLGPEFINSLFAKDNGIEEVYLTPQCAEKMLMLKGLSDRTRALVRLKLSAWKKLRVENVMAYLESDYCHTFDDHLTQNQKLTNLTKNLGKAITMAALANNQLSDSGRMRHIESLFPMLTQSECVEMIFPQKDWDKYIWGVDGQEADYERIGSLYLCGLAGWKPEITRTNKGDSTMTIVNDDRELSSQKGKSQSDRNNTSQAGAVDQPSHSKIQGQVDNNQSEDSQAEDEEYKQDIKQIGDSQDRLNFLALMKKKSIKQIAKSIAENHQHARKITGNIILHPKYTGVEMPTSQSTEERPRVRSGLDMGQNIASFLTSDDLKSLRAFQKSDQVKNNPDQDHNKENNENSEPDSGGGFRK